MVREQKKRDELEVRRKMIQGQINAQFGVRKR